jgi:hypothetical protein
MSITEDTAATRGRITKAEQERDRFLDAGMQERYMEACSMVQALEQQLEHQHQAALSARQENETMLADFRIAERIAYNAGRAMAVEPENRERLMLAYAITFDGRQYAYDRYRYDRLADAVNYARLQHPHPLSSDPTKRPPPRIGEPIETPSELQRELMSELGITLQAGVYHLGEYRYDHLSDAVEYARLKSGQ